jgi:hypothetical protein
MTTDPDTPEIDIAHERAQMLDVANALLEEAIRKLHGDGRLRDTEKAKARQGYMNSAWRGLKEKRLLLAEIGEASDIDERLEAIEEYVGLQEGALEEIDTEA